MDCLRIGRSARACALLAVLLSLSACASDDPAAPPTEGGEADATATPTPSAPTATPAASASLRLSLANPTGVAVDGIVSGRLIEASAAGPGLESYAATVDVAGGATGLVALSGLRPGVWLHTIVVSGSGQQQARRSLLVGDPRGRRSSTGRSMPAC